MANFNYFEYSASPSMSPTLSEPFFLFANVKWNGGVDGFHQTADGGPMNTSLSAADVLRVAPLKDHWIIKNAWYRVRTTFSGTMTVDIGVDGGSEIANDLDVTAAGDWIQGTIGKDSNGTDGAHKIMGADGYLTVLLNNAPPADGYIEILAEVVAGDRESADGV